MKLRLIASQPHYLAHLLPIWEQLPESIKGETFLGEDSRRWPQRPDRINLVAGYADVQRAPVQQYILVEHGAGQSYVGSTADGYYSGGRGHNSAVGFICPNLEVAQRWFRRYPDKPSAVVGSPRLDPWHSGERGKPEDRTVAITFHWDAQFTGVPETASGFGWWNRGNFLEDVVIRWRKNGWRVLGHWHPRYEAPRAVWEVLNRQYGVEVVGEVGTILDRASVLVADNTSLQADFLSLGRRVVWLSHPDYRRDVEHGGRFWTWPRTLGGTDVGDRRGLSDLDLASVPPATGHPYAYADGQAAKRAALAIRSWMGDLETIGATTPLLAPRGEGLVAG